MKIVFSLVSDVGCCRKNNEDNFYLNGIYRKNVDEMHVEKHGDYVGYDFLVGVFDGMGGEEQGEIASLIASEQLKKYRGYDFPQIATRYIENTNKLICDKMREQSGRMGSTLAIVALHDGKYHMCNVGDSVVFLYRNGELKQISMSHNEAQSLYEMGIITKEQLQTDKRKNKLTQHLGIFEEEMIIEPYVVEDKLQVDDWFLLCSDGLTDMVKEREIIDVLKTSQPVVSKNQRLMDMALKNGGKDNITIQLLHIIAI